LKIILPPVSYFIALFFSKNNFFDFFQDAQGVYHPLDETRPNPNGIEVNLIINFEILKKKIFFFFLV
jgi:hypothetical protein